jgi:hypothetical protein
VRRARWRAESVLSKTPRHRGLAVSPDDSSAAAESAGLRAASRTAARVADRGRACPGSGSDVHTNDGVAGGLQSPPARASAPGAPHDPIEPALDPGPPLTDGTAQADQGATPRLGESRFINQLLRHDDAATHLDHAGALKLPRGVAVVAAQAVPEGVRDVALLTCSARRKSLPEHDAAVLPDLGQAGCKLQPLGQPVAVSVAARGVERDQVAGGVRLLAGRLERLEPLRLLVRAWRQIASAERPPDSARALTKTAHPSQA